jgi:hypothetical protein
VLSVRCNLNDGLVLLIPILFEAIRLLAVIFPVSLILALAFVKLIISVGTVIVLEKVVSKCTINSKAFLQYTEAALD